MQSPDEDGNTDEPAEVQRGIYQAADGALYELIINQASAEDFEPVVVHRELFGDYQFFVTSPDNFHQSDSENTPRFTLVRAV